jgi:hypothetical protein
MRDIHPSTFDGPGALDIYSSLKQHDGEGSHFSYGLYIKVYKASPRMSRWRGIVGLTC